MDTLFLAGGIIMMLGLMVCALVLLLIAGARVLAQLARSQTDASLKQFEMAADKLMVLAEKEYLERLIARRRPRLAKPQEDDSVWPPPAPPPRRNPSEDWEPIPSAGGGAPESEQ